MVLQINRQAWQDRDSETSAYEALNSGVAPCPKARVQPEPRGRELCFDQGEHAPRGVDDEGQARYVGQRRSCIARGERGARRDQEDGRVDQ